MDATHQSLRTHIDRTVWTFYWALAEGAPAQNRQLLLDKDWNYWKEAILHDLERVHSDIRQCVSRMDIMRMGHAMIRPAVGSVFSEERHRLSRNAMAASSSPIPTSAASPSSKKRNTTAFSPPKPCSTASTAAVSSPQNPQSHPGLSKQILHPIQMRRAYYIKDAFSLLARKGKMLIQRKPELTYADVTPKDLYFDRRKFLQAMGIAGAVAFAGKNLARTCSRHRAVVLAGGEIHRTCKKPLQHHRKTQYLRRRNALQQFLRVRHRQNRPAKNAQKFRTSPWSVSVEGEVKTKRKFTMDEILKLAPLEERIYRHRCVEGWSIVVPWIGFSFSTIANLVQPTDKAKFVAFESLYDPSQMPEAKYGGIDISLCRRSSPR